MMQQEPNLYKEHTASLWLAWFFGLLVILLFLLCCYNQRLFVKAQESSQQLKTENKYLEDRNQELKEQKIYIQEKYKLLEEDYIKLQEKFKEYAQ